MMFRNISLLLSITIIARVLAVPVESEVLSTADSLISCDDAYVADAAAEKRDERPLVVLRPVGAPSYQEPSLAQVIPQPSVKLHFMASNDLSQQASSAVVVIPKLAYPAVNAVAASSITSVKCSAGQARVTFRDQDAYAKAATAWSSTGRFTLITYSESCGTGLADSTHDFILVHDIAERAPQTMSMTVNVETIQLEAAVDQDALVS